MCCLIDWSLLDAHCCCCVPVLYCTVLLYCRYREVPADSYGLETEEILGLDDKDLNQVVGLRALAAYR